MKLYTSDESELMEVSSLKTDSNGLIVSGTIMGAMPVEAILKPAELRKAFKLMSVGMIFSVLGMLFRK